MAALRLGDAAPGFDLPDVDGERHALSDYDGKPFAVVFSCCHCPYVVAWEDMARRSQERGFVFPFLYDETQEVARAYGAARTPEVFVFDAGHRLLYHGAPDSSHTDPDGAEPYLRPALDAAVAETQPEVQETPPVGCTIKWR